MELSAYTLINQQKGMITNMKKLSVLMLCFLLIGSLTVNAAYFDECDIQLASYADEWTFTNADINNDVLTLNATEYDKYGELVSSGGRITTSTFDVSQRRFVISFEGLAGEGEQFIRVASSLQTTTEIFRMSNGSISVFGQDSVKNCDLNKSNKITLAVDFSLSEPKASAWVNGELVFSGEYESLSKLDTELTYIGIGNDGDEKWIISNFYADCVNSEYSFSSSPENGSIAVNSETVEEILLDFGTVPGDIMYQKSNYELTENNIGIDFEIVPNKTSVKIIPENKLTYNADYSIKAKETVDIFGDLLDEISVNFSTLPKDYQLPEISLGFNPEKLNVYTKQTVPLEFVSDKKLDKMEIYIDDILQETLTAEPWVYLLKKDNACTVKLKAVGYDEYGAQGSVSTEIEVVHNDSPLLTVDGIADGAKYQASNLPSVKISAVDTDGIKEIIYDVDGVAETINADNAVFYLNNLTGGSHTIKVTAVDSLGIDTTKTFNITLESLFEIGVYQNDFTDYEGQDTLPEYMVGGPQRGYLDAGVVKEDFGKSLLIGMDTVNNAYQPNNSAYVGVPMNDLSGRARIEFDFYIEEKPGFMPADKNGNRATDYAMMYFKKNGSTETRIATFNHTGAVILGQSIEYSAKIWYHFLIDVNVAKGTVELTMTGNGINRTFTSRLTSGQDVINYLRIFGPIYDDVKTFIAIDNLTVKQIKGLPEISVKGEISSTSGEIKFSVSEALMLKDLTTKNITLTDEFGGVVEIDEIKGDTTNITLIPSTKLKSNTNYYITISSDTRYKSGSKLGLAVRGIFKTAMGDMNILDGEIADDVLRLNILNQSGAEVKVYAVAQIWSGSDIRRMKIIPFIISADNSEKEYNLDMPKIQTGEKLTVYLWDSIINSNAITSQIFTATK